MTNTRRPLGLAMCLLATAGCERQVGENGRSGAATHEAGTATAASLESDVLVTLSASVASFRHRTRSFIPPESLRVVDDQHVVIATDLPNQIIRLLEHSGVAYTHAIADCSTVRFSVSTDTSSSCTIADSEDPQYYAQLSNDPFVRSTAAWGLRSIGASSGLLAMNPESPVIVAVLDSGVDAQHPEFLRGASTMVAGDPPCTGNAVNCAHGTLVAGIIAAASNNSAGGTGIAPFVAIRSLKITNDDGAVCESLIAQGIRKAIKHSAHVINISAEWSQASPLIEQAMAATQSIADGRGALVVGGGSGYLIDRDRVYPARYSDSHGFVVSAAAFGMKAMLPSGPSGTTCSRSYKPGGTAINMLAAPGVSICSTVPNGKYGQVRGDSFAIPHVAAIAAMAWGHEQYRELNAAQIRDLLFLNACDAPSGPDTPVEVNLTCLANARFLESRQCPTFGLP